MPNPTLHQRSRMAKGLRYFEPLSDTLQLEMVQIPGGSFLMGQTEAETQELLRQVGQEDYDKYYARELPRHEVTVPGFFMGRYPVP